MKKDQGAVLNHFFRTHSSSISKCLEPGEACEEKAIRAHSIPTSAVLSQLSVDGHVVVPRVRHRPGPRLEISFEKIGVRKATIFTGLCARHDNHLFRAIDSQVPDLASARHLFLLAYRSIFRVYHGLLNNAFRTQSTYRKAVEEKLLPDNEPSPYGLLAVQEMAKAYDYHQYKRETDRLFLDRNWHELKHRIIRFGDQQPSIAASTSFPVNPTTSSDTPYVTLNVYPIDSRRTTAVLSFLKRHQHATEVYLDRLFAGDASFQKYLLSKIILQSDNNFVISPDYYDSMSLDKKAAVEAFYVQSIIDDIWKDYEDESLYLF